MTTPTRDGNADKRTARHTLRTILQVLVALAAAVPSAAAAFDFAPADVAKVMAVLGLVVVIVTALQNAAEQTGVLPTLLPNPLAKPQPPSAVGRDPQAGATYPGVPLLVAGLLLVLLALVVTASSWLLWAGIALAIVGAVMLVI